MPNQMQIAIESLSREASAAVSTDVAPVAQKPVCPQCEWKGPFEHLKKGALFCSRCREVFDGPKAGQ